MAHATQALDALSADPETQRMARDRADSEKLYAMSLRASREEGVAEGVEIGQRNALLRFLAARQFDLTPAQRAMIDAADLPTLESWTDLAFSGADLDELFAV